jgi:hypothetical protein
MAEPSKQVEGVYLHSAARAALTPELQALIEAQPLWRLGVALRTVDSEDIGLVPSKNNTICGTFGEV